jgi:hypothetical protein
MGSWTEQLAWLPVGDPGNPFPFEVLDCRAACAALTLAQTDGSASEAMTAIDAVVRATPSRLVPADGLSTACLIRVSSSDSTLARQLASPDQGHKWLLEIGERTILARRRWTGHLVHVAEFERSEGDIVITRLTSERQFVHGSSDYAAAEMEFLLRTYLEARRSRFRFLPD